MTPRGVVGTEFRGREAEMYLSVCTRELDNGFVLDAEIKLYPPKTPWRIEKEIHEVYDTGRGAQERIVGLLSKVVEQMKEDISEKKETT